MLFEQYGESIPEDLLQVTSEGILLRSVFAGLRGPGDEFMRGIELHAVVNNSVNAVALRRGPREAIAVFTGLPRQLIATVPSALADPQSWPLVGVPGKEAGGPVPRDATRSAFAMSAIMAALMFVAVHECAHILRGHLGHTRAGLGDASLPEIGFSRLHGLSASVLRAMEIDADRVAIGVFADSMLHRAQTDPHLTRLERQQAYIFGLGILFQLLSDADGGPAISAARTHPRASLRFTLAMHRLRTGVRDPSTANAEPELGQRDAFRELCRLFPLAWTLDDSGVDRAEARRDFEEVMGVLASVEPGFAACAAARVQRASAPASAT